ncbi:hypothetical protein BJY00DRAFT_312175 [Aspergillus carlsbadensis]|nr:hypothetical protein BJY00DRAFT_312175 [Aspergillus carlsbadensis]
MREPLENRDFNDSATTRFEAVLHAICASERGHTAVIEYLIQTGGERVNDVHAQDTKGQTALAVAAGNRALEAAALLLAAGAQPVGVPGDSDSHHWLQTHFGQLLEQRLDLRTGITDDNVLDSVYPPQRTKDQFKAYFYLKTASRQRLPPHLISTILDYAEYWLVDNTQRSEVLMVTELEFYNTPYLRSAPITGNPESPVRRAEFDITSHDQGWSDTHRGGWPYDHSQTWFEASRESSQGSTDKDKGKDTALHLSDPEIVRNVRASREWKRHRVFWPESLVRALDCGGPGDNDADDDKDDDTDKQSAPEFHLDPVHNAPMLLRWSGEIKPGDRVCLHMRAGFPGRKNYVRQAEVTVYTSALLPPATLKRLAGLV